MIDRALYLSRDWDFDDERRVLAGFPDEVAFADKPQQAAILITRARAQGFPARWVAGDEVYGGRALCLSIGELGFDYAIAVPATHRVDTTASRFETAAVSARRPRRAWQPPRTGHGAVGDRHYHWAMIEVIGDDTLHRLAGRSRAETPSAAQTHARRRAIRRPGHAWRARWRNLSGAVSLDVQPGHEVRGQSRASQQDPVTSS